MSPSRTKDKTHLPINLNKTTNNKPTAAAARILAYVAHVLRFRDPDTHGEKHTHTLT